MSIVMMFVIIMKMTIVMMTRCLCPCHQSCPEFELVSPCPVKTMKMTIVMTTLMISLVVVMIYALTLYNLELRKSFPEKNLFLYKQICIYEH